MQALSDQAAMYSKSIFEWRIWILWCCTVSILHSGTHQMSALGSPIVSSSKEGRYCVIADHTHTLPTDFWHFEQVCRVCSILFGLSHPCLQYYCTVELLRNMQHLQLRTAGTGRRIHCVCSSWNAVQHILYGVLPQRRRVNRVSYAGFILHCPSIHAFPYRSSRCSHCVDWCLPVNNSETCSTVYCAWGSIAMMGAIHPDCFFSSWTMLYCATKILIIIMR